ncbi:hypothetical protein SAMD00019534_086780 [Acytostelium subglobosum LB1]|uniref:hypothetical protein n=1 Tax=Acytostelium subglobosum LB1 TaxID=1410327 RepID=UPI000644BDDF|nr:hypothetical protein SAMD00019534_086780 [Acytostelium subglobosum LB1]GAM25503.1 hypothetical protein SAMD00019534_086780 [Acytostelium subglobosum LB1]|eukprot:XP_012751489.1 hypothetical protein SAMD00019534_086780 [Acytostelium subglobosum LB1]
MISSSSDDGPITMATSSISSMKISDDSSFDDIDPKSFLTPTIPRRRSSTISGSPISSPIPDCNQSNNNMSNNNNNNNMSMGIGIGMSGSVSSNAINRLGENHQQQQQRIISPVRASTPHPPHSSSSTTSHHYNTSNNTPLSTPPASPSTPQEHYILMTPLTGKRSSTSLLPLSGATPLPHNSSTLSPPTKVFSPPRRRKTCNNLASRLYINSPERDRSLTLTLSPSSSQHPSLQSPPPVNASSTTVMHAYADVHSMLLQGGLGNLPAELLISIFQHFGPQDICRVGLTCRWWQTVSEQDSLWLIKFNERFQRPKAILDKLHSQATTESWKELYTQHYFMDNSYCEVERMLVLFPVTPEYEHDITIMLYKVLNYLKHTDSTTEYIRKLEELKTIHITFGNRIEAANCLLNHCQLISWNGEATFPAEHGYPSEVHSDRKERLLNASIQLFIEGKHWERSLSIINKLRKRYKKDLPKLTQPEQRHTLIKKMVALSELEHTCYQSRDKEKRFFEEYFLVEFRGKGFPKSVDAKKFIFRGNVLEKLGNFVGRMKNRYPGAQVVPKTDKDDILTGQYVHIRPCKPIFLPKIFAGVQTLAMANQQQHMVSKGHTLRSHFKDEQAYIHNNSRVFFYSQPFKKKKKEGDQVAASNNEFLDLWTCNTYIVSSNTFPDLIRCSEVKSIIEIERNPLETAIEDLNKKNKQLQGIVDSSKEQKQWSQGLTMALNGVVDAAVSGGINMYRVFFSQCYLEENPAHPDLLGKLKDLLLKQQLLLEVGMDIHSQCCPENIKALQNKMELCFEKWKQIISELVIPTLSASNDQVSVPAPVPVDEAEKLQQQTAQQIAHPPIRIAEEEMLQPVACEAPKATVTTESKAPVKTPPKSVIGSPASSDIRTKPVASPRSTSKLPPMASSQSSARQLVSKDSPRSTTVTSTSASTGVKWVNGKKQTVPPSTTTTTGTKQTTTTATATTTTPTSLRKPPLSPSSSSSVSTPSKLLPPKTLTRSVLTTTPPPTRRTMTVTSPTTTSSRPTTTSSLSTTTSSNTTKLVSKPTLTSSSSSTSSSSRLAGSPIKPLAISKPSTTSSTASSSTVKVPQTSPNTGSLSRPTLSHLAKSTTGTGTGTVTGTTPSSSTTTSPITKQPSSPRVVAKPPSRPSSPRPKAPEPQPSTAKPPAPTKTSTIGVALSNIKKRLSSSSLSLASLGTSSSSTSTSTSTSSTPSSSTPSTPTKATQSSTTTMTSSSSTTSSRNTTPTKTTSARPTIGSSSNASSSTLLSRAKPPMLAKGSASSSPSPISVKSQQTTRSTVAPTTKPPASPLSLTKTMGHSLSKPAATKLPVSTLAYKSSVLTKPTGSTPTKMPASGGPTSSSSSSSQTTTSSSSTTTSSTSSISHTNVTTNLFHYPNDTDTTPMKKLMHKRIALTPLPLTLRLAASSGATSPSSTGQSVAGEHVTSSST